MNNVLRNYDDGMSAGAAWLAARAVGRQCATHSARRSAGRVAGEHQAAAR